MVFIGQKIFTRCTVHFTVHVKNPVAPLCVSKYCSSHYARQESCRHNVHVTVCVRILFMSLCTLGILQTHCSCHCARENTVHVTVDQFLTTKNVGEMFTALFTQF